ncbi:MAG: hypothetical protein LC798_07145 [Chloroflexi bacterium]|nr:hypothetical protein [Chloroflexota bacterium]
MPRPAGRSWLPPRLAGGYADALATLHEPGRHVHALVERRLDGSLEQWDHQVDDRASLIWPART